LFTFPHSFIAGLTPRFWSTFFLIQPKSFSWPSSSPFDLSSPSTYFSPTIISAISLLLFIGSDPPITSIGLPVLLQGLNPCIGETSHQDHS